MMVAELMLDYNRKDRAGLLVFMPAQELRDALTIKRMMLKEGIDTDDITGKAEIDIANSKDFI